MPSPLPSDPRAGVTRRQALGVLGALALPWENLRAQTPGGPAAPAASSARPAPAAPTLPDLANLHEIMAAIARDQAPSLSFLDARWRSLEEWKAAARPVFQARLSYQPHAVPLAAELLRREERDGFTIEHVRIAATAAYAIPARVLVPARREGRLPAVVGLHCHGGRYTWGLEKIVSSPEDGEALRAYREELYGGRAWTEALARRGFVVLAADAFYFGERRLRVEELEAGRVFAEVREAFHTARAQPPGSREWIAAVNRVCSFYEHLTAKTLTAAGATWPGLLAWDDRRTVDYLCARADVDPERIGCVGLSVGGLRAAHLIAADARIKAASVTGWMTEFAQQLRAHARHTWMAFVPGLYPSLDLPDAAALHAPGALLVQQCRRDTLYPLAAMQGAVDKLARIYAKAGLAERFRGTFYDEPHSFKVPAQEETFAWLERWL
jgi:dienelactone hydrolase